MQTAGHRGVQPRGLGFSDEIADPVRSKINAMCESLLQSCHALLGLQSLILSVSPSVTAQFGLVDAGCGKQIIDPEVLRAWMVRHAAESHREWIQANELGRGMAVALFPVIADEQVVGNVLAVAPRKPNNQDDVPCEEDWQGKLKAVHQVATCIGQAIENASLRQLGQDLVWGALGAICRTVDARDPYTQGHSQRVAHLSFELASVLGLSQPACEEIYYAGLLHDVGKSGIPDRILHKCGALTLEEKHWIHRHPEIGYQIVEQIGKLDFALPGILHHHERWDGHGYPHGLRGEMIPLMARVLAVADCHDALTTSRPYRRAISSDQAISMIANGADQQWDALVVESLLRWREINMNRPQPPQPQLGIAGDWPVGASATPLTASVLRHRIIEEFSQPGS